MSVIIGIILGFIAIAIWFASAFVLEKTNKTDNFFFKNSMEFAGAWILSFFIVGFVASLFISIPFVYSDGIKSGTLTKITKKGVIFKTYEGQLNLGGMVSDGDGGMIANVFNFSLTDEKIFRKLQLNQNNRVSLKYNQFLKVPIYVGSTSYIVNGVCDK